MNKNIRRFGRGVASLLYPPTCPVCDRVITIEEAGKTCKKCIDLVQCIQAPTCMKCGRVLSSTDVEYCGNCERVSYHFIKGFIPFLYEDLVRKLVLKFKYYGHKDLGLFFSNCTMDKYGEELLALHADAVIPIPVHKKRLIKRGYNQAHAYALELAASLGLPCLDDILIRTKATKAMKELSVAGRINNLLDAFAVDREAAMRHKKRMALNRVILVDDILTTGATVECATILLNRVLIKEVYVVSISSPRPF